jgi:hypothetical protein
LADVFYGQIEDRAWTRLDVSMLLANVMAHEVGHLLGAKHSTDGIMCGQWVKLQLQRARAGQLSFSAGEAQRLRSEAAARLGLPVLAVSR